MKTLGHMLSEEIAKVVFGDKWIGRGITLWVNGKSPHTTEKMWCLTNEQFDSIAQSVRAHILANDPTVVKMREALGDSDELLIAVGRILEVEDGKPIGKGFRILIKEYADNFKAMRAAALQNKTET